MEAVAGETTVACDTQSRILLAGRFGQPGRQAPPEGVGEVVGEVAVGDATDVVLTENVRGNAHGPYHRTPEKQVKARRAR